MNSMMSRTVDSSIYRFAVITIAWMLFSLPIYHDCMRLPRSGFHVFSVDTCPRNLSEVEAASRRLNCSGIQEFKNVYHCLPRFDLSHLVEFCYDGISGLVQEGQCMVLYIQTLTNHPCNHFTKGCPDKPYFAKDMFNYPACIDIDRQKKCYLMDPNCTSITSTPETTSIIQHNGTVLLGWIAAGVMTPFVVLGIIIVIILHRRRLSRSHRNTEQDQTNDETEIIPQRNVPVNTDHNWMSSTLMVWRNDDKLFVPTMASKAVENKTKNQNLVIVVGNSGSGKSAIIQHIALKYNERGWDVIPVDDVKEIKEACSTGLSKKVFVFHNPVGKESLNVIEYENWKRYENKLKTCLKEIKLLLSCRLSVFQDKRLKGMIKETNNSIRIDDDENKLSKEEKRQILHQYTKDNVFTDDQIEEIVRSEAYFPLLCKLISSTARYKERGVGFFKEPFEIVKREIEIYKDSKEASDESKYRALIVLVVFNNNVVLNDMEDCLNAKFLKKKYKDIIKMTSCSKNTLIISVTEGLELLEGSFVKCVGNSYKFIHDFVLEITTFIVGTKFPKETIKYADIGFLRRRVKIKDDEQNLDPFTVYLPDSCIDDLVQRFLENIQTKRLLEVVLNPCLRNKKVIDSFNNCLKRTDSLDLKCTLPKLDEYELGKEEENYTISRLSFFLTQRDVTPLSALIIFGHVEITSFFLEKFQLSGEHSTLASICANGNTPLYDCYSKKCTVKLSDVRWGGYYALHIASLFHNLEMTKTFISRGENINMLDNHGYTALMCAVLNDDESDSLAIRNSKATVDCLLVNGADVNLCDKNEVSPLYIACQNGHNSTVQLLLERGADINLCKNDGTSPLYIACQNGQESTVRQLLDNGADVNLCENDGTSPLYTACQNGHASTVQLLLMKKADIKVCKNGISPLYIACANGQDSTVRQLLNKDVDVNSICENDGASPLYIASKNGRKSTVQLLLNNGANIDISDKNGASPLYVGCKNGHDSTVQLLLNTGAKINLCEKNGASPLYICCQNGHDSTVELLVKNEAKVNLCDNDGVSPLYVACQNGHGNSVKLLLNNDADVNLCDKNRVSPLYIACQNGYDSTVHLLLTKGADINICKHDGTSPLHIACQNGHKSAVEQLLKHHAGINLHENNGCSPLYIACQNGHDSTVQLLLTNGAEINLCNNYGASPLFIACQNGHDSTIQQLLENGADINLCDNDGASPLYTACENGRNSTVQLLLKNGTDINSCNKNRASLLYIACQNGHDNTVQLLLNNGADINFCTENGVSPLYSACENGHESTVKMLLNNGADINFCKNDGTSPLYIACQNGHNNTVEQLLNYGAGINLHENDGINPENGAGPLYVACQNGHDSTVQLLLNNGADINLCNENGISPLHVACQNGHESTTQLLLNKGADINLSDNDGSSPLYIACENGHDSTVNLLLNKGGDIDSCNNDGASPLYIACRNGHNMTVKLLLNKGTNVNLADNNSVSPLYIACQNRQNSTVQLLLDNGADINLRDRNGGSPLYIACNNGYDNTVLMLLKISADIDSCDNDGNSPLYIACQNGHASTVQVLLKNGANIDLCNKDSASPLYVACQAKHHSVVLLLLNNGANVNLSDRNGNSPLHIARKNGLDSTVQLLLRHGANNHLCENDRVSPQYIVFGNEHDSTAQLLLEDGGDTNSCNDDEIAAVHKADEHGQNRMKRRTNITDINVCDVDRSNPLNLSQGYEPKFAIAECKKKSLSPLDVSSVGCLIM